MNTTIRKALPAALSVALVGGALALPAVATTTDEPTTSEESTADQDTTSDEDGRTHRHRLAHGALHSLEEGELAERLAAELVLDAETVQQALDAVKGDLAEERLATAVESGRLTQEQADRIAAAAEAGTLDEVLPEIRLEELEERLAERVADGELTQQEADQILAEAEDGNVRTRRGFDRTERDRDRGTADAEADDTAADDTSSDGTETTA